MEYSLNAAVAGDDVITVLSLWLQLLLLLLPLLVCGCADDGSCLPSSGVVL
jgi:hypothetical protein